MKSLKESMNNDKHGKPGSGEKLVHKNHYVVQMMKLLIDAGKI